MEKLTIKIKDILKGDKLSDGVVVIEKPFDSVRCPKGKTHLTIERRGVKSVVTWNKESNITVYRDELA